MTEPQHPTADRRRAPRQKSFLRGTVHFNNRRSVLDCLIRDFSATGARLMFSDPVTTPDTIELHIPHKNLTVACQVAWRHGQELGVAFAPADAAAIAGEPADLTERVTKLEVELAALKRIIKRLRAEASPDSDVA